LTGADDEVGENYEWGNFPISIGDKILIVPRSNFDMKMPNSTARVDRNKLLAIYYDLKRTLSDTRCNVNGFFIEIYL